MARNSYYDEDLTDEEIDKEYEEEDTIVSLLSVASIWFIRFGLVVGVILFLYFILTGKIFTAILYVIGLIIAYFFGYFFMFFLDKFTDNN